MITVVTPTYNRLKTLPQCYESLLSQTSKKFLWTIVDDGSTDDTEQIVNSWIKENKIPIEYLRKENGGKASALNLALDHLNTDYVVCLDSDDTFYPHTIECALEQLEQVKNDDTCCGILALRTSPEGTVMGGREIPRCMDRVRAEDIFLKLALKTELICFYKSEIIKRFRFPVFEGEKFVSPAWMQYEVTTEYTFKTSWDKLCCCEYVADGLTMNKRMVIVKNPRGYTCVKRQTIARAKSLKKIIKNCIMYDCGCFLGADVNWLKNSPRKFWTFVLMPLGILVYWKRFRKIKKSIKSK